MKYILLFLLPVFILSCAKDPDSPSGINASGSIQYKVNGNSVVMNNVDLLSGQYVIFSKQLKGNVVPNTRYLLNAQNGVNNILIFSVVSDSLQKINYHYDSTSVYIAMATLNYNGTVSGIIKKGDYIDINITDYTNSKISGNFTAKLTPIGGIAGTTMITEGKINAIQVIY